MDGQIKNLIITGLLVSAVVLGFSGFTSSMATEYSVSSEDVSYLNVTSEMQTHVNELEESIRGAETSTVSFIDVLATGTFETLKLMFSLPNIFGALLTDISVMIGLPVWVTGTIMAIITVIVVFGIIKVITKVEP